MSFNNLRHTYLRNNFERKINSKQERSKLFLVFYSKSDIKRLSTVAFFKEQNKTKFISK